MLPVFFLLCAATDTRVVQISANDSKKDLALSAKSLFLLVSRVGIEPTTT
jgi:hypothetical protein